MKTEHLLRDDAADIVRAEMRDRRAAMADFAAARDIASVVRLSRTLIRSLRGRGRLLATTAISTGA